MTENLESLNFPGKNIFQILSFLKCLCMEVKLLREGVNLELSKKLARILQLIKKITNGRYILFMIWE